MELILLRCPSCDGEVELDASGEFGTCTYCGNKVLLSKEEEDIFETEEVERKEQLIKRGNIFLKLKEYSKATENFEKLLENYPDSAEGYYKLMIAMTENFSIEVYDMEEIGRYSSHMVSVAPEKEKEKYLERKEKIKSYMEKIQVRKEKQKEEEILKNKTRVFKNTKYWVKMNFIGFFLLGLGAWLISRSRIYIGYIKFLFEIKDYEYIIRYFVSDKRIYYLLIMCAGLAWILLSCKSCRGEKKEKKHYLEWRREQEEKIQELKYKFDELEKKTEELQKENEEDAV